MFLTTKKTIIIKIDGGRQQCYIGKVGCFVEITERGSTHVEAPDICLSPPFARFPTICWYCVLLL